MTSSRALSRPYPHIATIDHLGRRYAVTCRIAFDGIEYVGRLWFADDDDDDVGLPDRAAIPGRTRDEVLDQARRLTENELRLRYRRALAEKRRFISLRRETDDILTKIRYLNQIALSVREGLLDEEGANQEIETTERQLQESIKKLRHTAGVEEE
ncbi:MAG TPA: hypothetical protein VGP95_02655 [Gemmatimonadaceae bacterium]|jgi:hypothetical protein|nr:hypothetical protein [Gemmatimonadaceae bacterium]